MLEEPTPQKPAMSKNLIERLKPRSSVQLFSGLLALLALGCVLADLPYGSFLLLLSVMLLVNSRVGMFLLLLSIAGIYFTSDEFLGGRDGSHDGVLDCAVMDWEQIPECKSRAERSWITGVDSKGVEHKFYVLFALLHYPTEAYLFGVEYSASVVIELFEDGTMEAVSITSHGSDMRPLFDESLRQFLSDSIWVKTTRADVSFPVTSKINDLQFGLDGLAESTSEFAAQVAFFLLMFSAAGAMASRERSLLHFSADVAAPTGIYVAAFYTCAAVASFSTTNYELLGKGLLIGASFLGVGVIASALHNSAKQRYLAVSPLTYILIALIPVAGLGLSFGDPLLSLWTVGSHPYLIDLRFVFDSVFNGYVLTVLSSAVVLNFVVAKDFSTRKKLDFLITSSATVVTVSIVMWFFQMGEIIDDYVAIFPVIKIAATGIACTSLLFIFAVLAADRPVPQLALRRRVFLLLEVFTFYLFFAYTPATVSQLGQKYVQVSEEREEKAGLEERLKTIEELLDIEPSEPD